MMNDADSDRKSDQESTQISAREEKKNKLWVACVVVIITLARIGHGMFVSISGPTLLFLADNVNAEVKQVSAIFTGRSLGLLLGAMGYSGIAYRFPNFKPLFSLGIGLGITGIVMYLTPFMTTLWSLVIVTTIGGLMFGYLDSGMQSVYLKLWGEEASRPYIQSFHFGFSVGAFLAPVIAKPFLEMANAESNEETSCPNYEQETTTISYTMTQQYDNYTTSGDKRDFNPINWCYIITGTYIMIMAIIICVAALFNAEDRVRDHNIKTTEARQEEPLKDVWFLFLVLIGYYFCCVSTETVYSGYIYSISFCSDLKFSVSQASLLNSLFWIGFTIGRGSAIIYSNYFKPTTIIIVDLIGSTLALIIMSIWGEDVAEIAWAMTFIHGVCVATLYSSGVSWTSQVTNMAGSYMFVFMIGNALGAMTMMPAGGALFDINPFSVIYLICGLCIANIAFFALMNIIAQHRHRGAVTKTSTNDDDKNDIGHCNHGYEKTSEQQNDVITPL